ncbi:MAG: hypothetical protein PVI97_05060 [Candidatus Thiodiazotropha sp.]
MEATPLKPVLQGEQLCASAKEEGSNMNSKKAPRRGALLNISASNAMRLHSGTVLD